FPRRCTRGRIYLYCNSFVASFDKLSVNQKEVAESVKSSRTMQEERLSQTSSATFKGFLLTNRRQILIILILGLALRMAFVIPSPPAANDALSRYIRTANNILDGHGFTNDKAPPYLPGESIVP